MAALRNHKQILGKKNSKRLLYSVLILIGLIIIFFSILGFKTYRVYESDLPSFEQLHNIEPSINTKVYDRNGVLLKEFYSENRVLTPLDEMPPYLPQMLIASEDQEFYDHWGINMRRIAITVVSNLMSFEIDRAGASTVTQQLARMLFLTQKKTMERKIKEALTAIKLERTYSKDEILEMYLNQHYFSRGAYGVAAAARMFFDKQVSELDYNDCAILIGLLKGPNINSPLNNPDKAVQARNRVLYSYYEWGGIAREVFDSLRNEPLKISPPEEKAGIAPYFTETIRQYIQDKYGDDVLYSGGLKIYTSLDADLQREAEQALGSKIDTLRAQLARRYTLADPNYTINMPDTVDAFGDSIRVYKPIQSAMVAIDNSNGDVLVMIGGRSFEESKWNRATQSLLQPGSVFKPFVYTAAIDNGYRTTDIIDDNPIVLDIPGTKQWRPHNYDFKFLGPITLREGLAKSRNLVAIRLLLKIQPEQAIFYARRMGISSHLDPVPSLAIGVGEVRPIEIISAFSTFPNKGVHIPYRLIHRIVNRYNRELENNTLVRKDEVLSAQTAYIMVSMMQSVMSPGGTGIRARWMGFNRPAGGKTGTSNSFCDNWFIGYTPQITAGVWVGFDDKTSLGRNQDGSKNALPIWTDFMIKAHDSLPIEDFAEPEGIVHADVCLESGELATDRCINVREEVFIEGTEPTKTCTLHPSAGRYDPARATRQPEIPADSSDEPVHF